MEEKFQSELRCCRRNRGESLRELAQDIQMLMILAYPGEQSSLSEHLTRDAFLSALADPEFELKIREREPTNLDDPLRIAQRYEVFSFSTAAGERQAAEIYSADESSSETTKSAVQTEDGKRYVELNGSSKRRDLKNGDSGWKEEIIQRLGNLETAKQEAEQLMESVTFENAALKKEVDKLRYLQQIRAAPNRIPGCHHGESSSSRYPRATRASGLCFKCGQAGHFQRNCPNRNQQPHQLDCMVQNIRNYIQHRLRIR